MVPRGEDRDESSDEAKRLCGGCHVAGEVRAEAGIFYGSRLAKWITAADAMGGGMKCVRSPTRRSCCQKKQSETIAAMMSIASLAGWTWWQRIFSLRVIVRL